MDETKIESKWTDEVKERLGELVNLHQYTDRQIGEMLGEEFGDEFTKDSVRHHRLNICEDDTSEDTLIKFLCKGRSLSQIAQKLKITLDEAEDIIDQEYEGYEIWNTEDEYGQQFYICLPEIQDKIELKKRNWIYQMQPDGQPWIWIRFEDKSFTKYNEIRIVPLSDVHFGASAHLTEKLDEYVKWVEDTSNVFVFINGDLLENALGDSIGGAVYESTMPPEKQLQEMTIKLAPIAHKILWALPGNHEDRTRKHAGIDPLKYICSKLEIPYFNDAVHSSVWWKNNRWDFYTRHGTGNAQTKGGKMNQAQKPAKYQEFVNFVVMGHVHDDIANPVIMIVRDYKNFELLLKKQYIVVCPSFMGYFNTYASKAGMEPGATGAISCILYSDGDYKADIW